MLALKNTNGSSASTTPPKSQLLDSTFSPPPPPNPITPASVPPQSVGKFEKYSQKRILETIAKSKPYKAPGPDGIPNVVLINCANLISSHLEAIYDAIFAHDIYPSSWKQFTTIVLRKPGKPDYTNPNAYRPI